MKPPSFLSATMRIFDLSLGEMLWARRTIFMALLVAGPVCLALVSRLASASGTAILRINGERVGSAGIFGAIVWVLFLRFIVPALGVFYGTSLIADEVEDKTITYLFTRPIPRRSIVLGKYLAYLVCSTSVVLPSVTLVFLLMVPFANMATAFLPLLQDLGILAIGLAAYGALFMLAGVALRRPLVAGLVFAFGWEQIALVMPGYLRYATVAYYLRALVPQVTPGWDTLSLFQSAAGDVPSAPASLFSLALLTLTALILAMQTVERREYVLEQ